MNVQNSLTITGPYDSLDTISGLICNFDNLRFCIDNLSNEEGCLTAGFDSKIVPLKEMKTLLNDFSEQNLNIELRYLNTKSGLIGVLKADNSKFNIQAFSYSDIQELENHIDHFDGHDLGENEVLNLTE
jgi:hypothetical protein